MDWNLVLGICGLVVTVAIVVVGGLVNRSLKSNDEVIKGIQTDNKAHEKDIVELKVASARCLTREDFADFEKRFDDKWGKYQSSIGTHVQVLQTRVDSQAQEIADLRVRRRK